MSFLLPRFHRFVVLGGSLLYTIVKMREGKKPATTKEGVEMKK